MKRIGKVSLFILLTAVTVMCLFGCNKAKFSYFDTTKPVTYGENDAVFQVGDNNNGAEKYGAEMDRLTSVTGSDRQLKFLDLEYYNFIHFGMNTFTNREWGTGKESPSLFNPTALDTDQWCESLLASGSKGVILTAKHHDGFCLWQTDTTEHSVKNSPYKGGKGDVVAELAESCKKYGLKFGLYLSPWDMNAETYGHNSYNDFYIEQLTELLTRYGELFCLWFDGARGENAVLDEDFEYDWDRIIATVRKYQPDCVMNVQGPDVRWVGNEAGVARDSEWCIKGGAIDPDKVAELSQTNPAMANKLQKITYNSEDIGSREVLAAYKTLNFYPAEADVSIRKGWFYHWNQSPKSLEQLLKIYYKTAGANCSMLLNVPPNKEGLIDKKDVSVLKQFGDKIASDKANPVSYKAAIGSVGGGIVEKTELSALYTEGSYAEALSGGDNAFGYAFQDNETVLDLKLSSKTRVSMITIREDLRFSERIEKYDVYLKTANGWFLVSNSTNVGNRRTVVIDPKYRLETDTVRIVVRQSRNNPVLRSVGVYAE